MRSVLLLTVAAITTACAAPAPPSTPASSISPPSTTGAHQHDALNQEILRLSNEIAALRERQPETDQILRKLDRVQNLERQISSLSMKVHEIESSEAIISTEQSGYSLARTNFGPFAVISKEASPYLDGYKVVLGIGNLTSATFHGATLKVGWGKSTRQFDLTTTFYPGSFNTCDVILTPADASEVKRLSVGIELKQISLR